MLAALTLSFASLACFVSAAAAVQSANLAWDANSESDIAGYRVYYGSASRTYTQQIDVGNTTTATISNLVVGASYFLAVTAYDVSGVESPLSNEVVFPVPQKTLSNVSTRSLVEQGDNVTVCGLIIKGENRVLVRALGPSLTSFGVSGALADPAIDLYDSTGVLIASNDNWRASQETEIQESGLAPTDDFESAIIATLPEGMYTAVVRGSSDAVGVALVEVFNLNQGTFGFTNLSTRADIKTGDNVVISGFILGGDQPTKVMIRALGPSLMQYGISNALLDPSLELHDQNGSLILQNDDWGTDQAQEILSSGIPPSDTKESAIIATLPPSSYTAIVRGAANSTGVGLVEIYNLDQ